MDDTTICSQRGQGAVIDLIVVDESIRLWVNDDAFIDESIAVMTEGHPRIPMFGEVRLGTDCDDRYHFHVAPGDVNWVDMAVEFCDARPSYIESDPAQWIESVGSWCPFQVTAIDEVVDGRDSESDVAPAW